MACQDESRAERIEGLQHLETLLRAGRNTCICRDGEIGVGADFRTAHTPAQLVQLRKPKAVRAIDNQRIGGRYVETALDDRRRKQHVVLAVVECVHHVIEFGRTHLTVRTRHA